MNADERKVVQDLVAALHVVVDAVSKTKAETDWPTLLSVMSAEAAARSLLASPAQPEPAATPRQGAEPLKLVRRALMSGLANTGQHLAVDDYKRAFRRLDKAVRAALDAIDGRQHQALPTIAKLEASALAPTAGAEEPPPQGCSAKHTPPSPDCFHCAMIEKRRAAAPPPVQARPPEPEKKR